MLLDVDFWVQNQKGVRPSIAGKQRHMLFMPFRPHGRGECIRRIIVSFCFLLVKNRFIILLIHHCFMSYHVAYMNYICIIFLFLVWRLCIYSTNTSLMPQQLKAYASAHERSTILPCTFASENYGWVEYSGHIYTYLVVLMYREIAAPSDEST